MIDVELVLLITPLFGGKDAINNSNTAVIIDADCALTVV